MIDTDPGIDDALAILLACASPEVDLRGVTTVTATSAWRRRPRTRCACCTSPAADVPVAAGAGPAGAPAAARARHVHGAAGVHGVPLPPPPRRWTRGPPSTCSPADPAARAGHGRRGRPADQHGPAVRVYPDAAARIGRLVVMGGAAGGGNVTPRAEFNVWADPEAAYRVLTEPGLPRPVPTTLVTMDVTMAAPLTDADLDRLGAGGPAGRAARAMLKPAFAHYEASYGTRTVAVHDAVAVAEMVRPGLLMLAPATVVVDRSDGPGRGATTVDLAVTAPGMTVSVGADADALVEFVVGRVAAYGS